MVHKSLTLFSIALLTACTAANNTAVIVPDDEEETFMKGDEEWMRFEDEETDVAFDYRIEPDGYVIDEVDDGGTAVKTVVLMRADDLAELEGATDPREGPPAVGMHVYANDDEVSLQQWLAAHPESNFQTGVTLEPVTIGGQKGVQYVTDGLFASDVRAVAVKDHIFIFSVAYLSSGDGYRTDGAAFVETVRFLE